jgi:hypothetical protein
VRFAEILAGYGVSATAAAPRGAASNPDAQIGSVTIGGNIHATNIVAGAAPGPDGRFGTADDVRIATIAGGNDPKLVSRIASVIIKGTVEPTAENYGIIAQHIVSVKVGATSANLLNGAGNDTATSATDPDPGSEVVPATNFRAVELPL